MSKSHKFSSMWVVEWLHKPSGEWTAIEGYTCLSMTRYMMRKWREDTRFLEAHDKFRISKYVRMRRVGG